jgi:nucleoporin POM152
MTAQASKQATVQPQGKPLIPENYLDVPSQRLYYLSLGALCQVPAKSSQYRFLLLM